MGALALAGPARADDESISRARALAIEAGDLLDEKRFQEALQRASDAEGLYHAPIHLLMIGQALEGLGRLADAAEFYERLVAEPLPPSAPPVFLKAKETGKEQLRTLLARVPSVLVTVQGPTENVAVTIDGKAADFKDGTAVRVNPGSRVIVASAPGFTSNRREIVLPERGGVVRLTIRLTPEGGAEVAPPAPPPVAPKPDAAPTSDASPRSSYAAPMYVAYGVGGLGVVIGAITGAMTLSRAGEIKDACPTDQCTSEHEDDLSGARTLGTVSTTAFVIGAVGIAAGTTLLVLELGRQKAERPRASASIGVGAGAVKLHGRF